MAASTTNFQLERTMPLEILHNKAAHLCPVKGCRHPRSKAWNGVCSRCAMRNWRESNPLKAAFAHLRNSAYARRKAFALTLEQFATFCERTAYLSTKGPFGFAATIDRIDAARGYEIDNLQILTRSENSIKQAREAYAVASYSGGGEPWIRILRMNLFRC